MRITLFKEQIQEIGQDNHGSEEDGQTDVALPWYRINAIGWIAPLLQLVLFVLLALLVRKYPILNIDIRITHTLQKKRSPLLRSIAKILTYCCGSPAILRTTAVGVALYLWAIRLRLEAIMTLGITFSSALLKNGLQSLINRPRPSPLLIEVYQKSKGKSFPSGHVITSLTSWGWFMALYIQLFKRKSRWQRAVLSIPALFIGITGPTRIYLGDHWASDVLGGYLFGSAYLSFFVYWYKRLKRRDK